MKNSVFDKKRYEKGLSLIVSFLIIVLTGCRTQYVAMPEVHQRDSLHVSSDHRYDSIYIDRTHIERDLPSPLGEGPGVRLVLDSIYVEKFTDVEHHDTITVTRVDSIPYPVEVPVEVEKPIPRVYRYSLWFVIVFFLYLVFCIIKAVYLHR